jgi:6-phosphogluconolactonase
MTRPKLIREADVDGVAVVAAELFTKQLDAALAARGVAHVALAGGSTPQRMYELLSHERWDGVEFWFGDERCVGPEDPQSNYRMAREALLDRVPGPIVVHRMEGELGAEAAASAYNELLEQRLPKDVAGVPLFDVIQLGLGEDAHTASLFPLNPALEADGVWCVPVHNSPKPPPDRLSLSLQVLRAARECTLLVAGSGKAQAMIGALGEPSAEFPSSLLARERLTVIADEAALAEVAPA